MKQIALLIATLLVNALAAERPRLQIINGTSEPADIFWLKSETERVANGSVAPGKDTIITTTIGHRFAVVGRESKTEALVTSEVPVQGFRFGGVPAIYTQSVSAGGFPIVASAKVNPYALKEAAFLADLMLAQRPDVRAAMIKSGARMCIMAHNEYTTDLPEWAHLTPKDYRDARARGMGGSLTDPYCSCAEENVLGYPGDPYSTECIVIHEFAHNIHLRGMVNVDPTFDPRLKAAYDAAMKAGLWKGKYASVNHHEYFAEGVQSWFDDNRENDHDHNHVNTRAELLAYDPGLAALCREVFGDTVIKYTKPATRLTGHMAGYDPAKAPTFVWPERLAKAKAEIKAKAQARDKAANGDGKRDTCEICGWTLHIDNALLTAENQPATTRALELLKAQLDEIIRVVPAAAVVELKKVSLYFSPAYPKAGARAEYHPGAGWLRDNGRDPVMAKGVEFTNIPTFEAETRRMPNFVLHELAHAYHDRFLPKGFGNPDIKAAYEKAKAGGKYESVERQDSEGRKRMDRAYALTNPQEYFAETTEAFFTRNDFFPYTRDELNQHDPEMFTLLGTLWGGVAKPNILLILADDLGYGDVGCYNPESKVPTPHLDRLARDGMRFTDAHSPSTVCTPTRYSLLTGEMAFRINYRGVFAGVGGPCLIKKNQLTLPQMLRARGYATAMTGKWHVGLSFFDKDGQRITKGGVEGVKMIDYSRAIPDAPIHRGFDRFFGTACCPGTDYLYAFIDGDRIPVPPTGMLDKSKLPKHPYAFDNRAGMIAPDFDLEEVDLLFLKKSREFLEQHAKSQPEKPFFLLHSTHAAHLPSFAAKQFQGSTKAGPHGDFIHELDSIVGELMKTLERLGMAENTVVMLSSDNGPETTSVIHMRADYGHDGARPWRGVKRDQWEGGHRVPFIVRWPGKIAAGSTSDQTVCLTDVMATCAAMTGAALPGNAAEDSFDLLPVLLGKTSGAPARPYTLHQTISLALAIRRGPWKYLDHRGSGGNNYDKGELKSFALPDTAPSAPGQLYNLDTDPGETNNLYFKQPEVVRELKALLERSKATHGKD